MLTRRGLLAAASVLAAHRLVTQPALAQGAPAPAQTKIALVKDRERGLAIPAAIALLGVDSLRGKRVLIKPNFNTADPFPASTHPDTLVTLIEQLRRMGAAEIAIGERCGPPLTANVLNEKGIPELCHRLSVGLIDFEELPPNRWVRVRPPGSHWRDGFDVAKPVLAADAVVSTCCLKTHGFGGVFTLSLKLAVGLTHKRFMRELHSSADMRKMIAEINQAFSPALIVLDGTDAFTDGGPSYGTLKHAGVILAGTDRVAIDAVGLAVLKDLGSNAAIMDTPIFRQEQIARAVELGLGVGTPQAIELVTDDLVSRRYGQRLTDLLARDTA